MTSWGAKRGGYTFQFGMTHSQPSNYMDDEWCY